MMNESDLMKAKDVCKLLGISMSSLLRLQQDKVKGKNNFPKPIMIGSRTRFWFRDEIFNYIKDLKENR